MMANQQRLQNSRILTRLGRNSQCGSRSGVSLIEILMSLMVMGIGLVSVAALFPISMLRSIQATKLTNGALLAVQSQDYLKAFPDLARNHYNGTVLVPNFEFTPASITWNRRGAPADVAAFRNNLPGNYTTIIDPIGMLNYSGPNNADEFGSDVHGLHAIGRNFYAVDRTNGGFNLVNATQRALAFEMFTSRDSWSSYLSSIKVTKTNATELVLTDASAGDMAEFQQMITDNVAVRAIVVNFVGKQSHISPVSGVVGNTITLSNPLPANGLFNAIPEVQLQIFESRYSTLISVRKQLTILGPDGQPGIRNIDDDNSDGDNNPLTGADGFGEIVWPGSDDGDYVRILGADLVIFFRRDFSPYSEQVYGVENMRKGSLGATSQPVKIYWDSTKPLSKPTLKPGTFVCDPVHGHWYKIRSIIEEEAGGTAQVTWIGNNNDRYTEIELENPPQIDTQFLMVYKDVIEVYPIAINNPYKQQ